MLGEKLKKIRLKEGMTQEDLAKKLNISTSTVSMYETGAREPDLNTLTAIAKFFNVSTDYLLGLSENQYFDFKSSENVDITQYTTELAAHLEKIIDLLKKNGHMY